MERLHPVAGEQEIPVYIEIAAIVAVHFGAKTLQDFRLVHPFGDPPDLFVAERSTVTALDADIVRILSASLVRPDYCIVTVNGSRNTRPDTFAAITALNEREATGKCIIHALAFTFIEDSWPPTVTTCHRPVVLVLSKAVNKAVPDHYRFQVYVVFLMA